MSITCCICGKKQSGWIIDYPLSSELSEYRVCMECGEKYQKIQSAERLEDVADEIAYLKERLAKGGKNDEVINLFSLLFNESKYDKAFQDIDTAIAEKRNDEISHMMVTSGYNFEGYKIIQYCDYISAETAFGIGMFKALLASVSSVAGAESESFNKKIKEAKTKAIYEIKKSAIELGANAIIGINLNFSMIAGEMVVIIASGTAVIIEKLKENR